MFFLNINLWRDEFVIRFVLMKPMVNIKHSFQHIFKSHKSQKDVETSLFQVGIGVDDFPKNRRNL